MHFRNLIRVRTPEMAVRDSLVFYENQTKEALHGFYENLSMSFGSYIRIVEDIAIVCNCNLDVGYDNGNFVCRLCRAVNYVVVLVREMV